MRLQQKPIQVANDGRGNIYSYIEIVPSDNVAMPGYSGQVTVGSGGIICQGWWST